MSSKPVSLLGMMHVCPKLKPRPHVGGPVVSAGQAHVKFNGIPLAVEGGDCLCVGVPMPDGLAKGSTMVRINGKGVMRVGDQTSHGGKMVMGVPTLKMC